MSASVARKSGRMRLLSLVEQLTTLVAHLEEVGGMICLVSIALLVNFQFLDRFSSSPTVWTEEVSRILLIWLAYLGCSAVTRRGVHIGVDLVVARLRGIVKHIAVFLLSSVEMLLFGLICWQGVRLLQASRGVELATTEWPISVIIWALIVGAGLSFLHALARCLRPQPASAPPTIAEV